MTLVGLTFCEPIKELGEYVRMGVDSDRDAGGDVQNHNLVAIATWKPSLNSCRDLESSFHRREALPVGNDARYSHPLAMLRTSKSPLSLEMLLATDYKQKLGLRLIPKRRIKRQIREARGVLIVIVEAGWCAAQFVGVHIQKITRLQPQICLGL